MRQSVSLVTRLHKAANLMFMGLPNSSSVGNVPVVCCEQLMLDRECMLLLVVPPACLFLGTRLFLSAAVQVWVQVLCVAGPWA